MSPGFMPRPSLSDPGHRRGPSMAAVSPGFMPRPSLSDRRGGCGGVRVDCVAGVHAPAFVERGWLAPARPVPKVSPGFMPRPSLSGPEAPRRGEGQSDVSPGFMPRPSLSAESRPLHTWRLTHVSPGFMPRPSLSDDRTRSGVGGGTLVMFAVGSSIRGPSAIAHRHTALIRYSTRIAVGCLSVHSA